MAALATVLLALAVAALGCAAEPPQREGSALQAFLAGTPHERVLGWSASTPACAWFGVTCDAANATVVALRLPGVGLIGRVPQGTLGRLSGLQILSLHSNRLFGAIPADLFSLPELHSLYLQGNLLSGAIPPDVVRLSALQHLVLSQNNLSGAIPFALNSLTELRSLRLDGNRLSGNLPSISLPRLEVFNVSYNQLNGSIPSSLAHFPRESFAGNLHLCGKPLDRPCEPFIPSPAPAPGVVPPGGGAGVPVSEKRKKLSGAAVAAIAVGAGAAALLALVLLVLCAASRRRAANGNEGKAATPARGLTPSTASGEMGELTSSSKEMSAAAGAGAGAGAAERSRLVFVGKDAGYSFDLEDLLRASAEVLGKGSLGISYKAVLEEGTTVVVKRLKDVAAARREFASHLEALGKVEHRNLLPVRGYYFSKDEKLLVADYLPTGSLSAMLHGVAPAGRRWTGTRACAPRCPPRAVWRTCTPRTNSRTATSGPPTCCSGRTPTRPRSPTTASTSSSPRRPRAPKPAATSRRSWWTRAARRSNPTCTLLGCSFWSSSPPSPRRTRPWTAMARSTSRGGCSRWCGRSGRPRCSTWSWCGSTGARRRGWYHCFRWPWRAWPLCRTRGRTARMSSR